MCVRARACAWMCERACMCVCVLRVHGLRACAHACVPCMCCVRTCVLRACVYCVRVCCGVCTCCVPVFMLRACVHTRVCGVCAHNCYLVQTS